MEWQPIETAPKDGTEVLLALNGRVRLGHFSDVERRDHGEVTSHLQYWYLGFTPWGGEKPVPTHWMPIPPAPKEIP